MVERRQPVERHRRILETLRVQGPRTAQELSALLGGRSVGMRAHLRQLKAAGLIAYEEEHRDRGRPVRRFRVTEDADALFPKRYELLAAGLADAIVAQYGPKALERILETWRDDLARYFKSRLPEKSADRLQALAKHQTEIGFMAEVEGAGRETALVERNCPIAAVAKRYPRICDYEAALFRKVLGRPVTLDCCQARGSTVCRFKVGS